MGRASIPLLVVLSWLALPVTVASADVVRPPPSSCPPGHEPRTGHTGPYCKPPPPTGCPAGHVPKVYRDRAYCEPPPAEPCPWGAEYTSRSDTDTYCVASWTCSPEGECSQEGATCRETSFCVRWRGTGGRVREAVVSGTCDGDASACPKGEQCMTAKRCDSRAAPPPPASNDLGAPEPPASAPTAAPPPDVEVVPNPGQPALTPGRSGCAGCSTAPSGALPVPLAGLALACIGLRRRRGRRPAGVAARPAR